MDRPLIYDRNSVQIYRINEKTYYRAGDLDRRRQCNGGFLLLEDSTIAIDVPSVEGAREMLQESLELFGRPVRYAFLTHAHPDHDLGLPVFAEKGNITLLAARTARAELEAQGIRYPSSFIGVEGTAELRLGTLEVVLETVGVTAHSPWDMLVWLPSSHVIFTGDLVACEPVLYLESCCLKDWVEVLQRLKKRDLRLLARGHGGCSGKGCLDKEIEYLTALRRVNGYLRKNLVIRQEDVRDEFMGQVLLELCRRDCTSAKLLYEVSGDAAFYQLTQFYRYNVAP